MYGEMPDDEFEAQRADIEAQLRQAESIIRPSHHEAAAVFGDLPRLWSHATADEKRRIAGLLLDRVYIDMDAKLITVIVPTAEFGLLLQYALEAADRADILLVPLEHVDALDALHAFATGEQVEAWTSQDHSGDGRSSEQPVSRRNVGDGGDGGELNSPSRARLIRTSTSVVTRGVVLIGAPPVTAGLTRPVSVGLSRRDPETQVDAAPRHYVAARDPSRRDPEPRRYVRLRSEGELSFASYFFAT